MTILISKHGLTTLLFKRINVPDKLLLICLVLSFLRLKHLHSRPLLFFFRLLDIFVQIFRAAFLLALLFTFLFTLVSLLLTRPSLSLVLLLHLILIFLDQIEEVLRHEKFVAQFIEDKHEAHGDSWCNEKVDLSSPQNVDITFLQLCIERIVLAHARLAHVILLNYVHFYRFKLLY